MVETIAPAESSAAPAAKECRIERLRPLFHRRPYDAIRAPWCSGWLQPAVAPRPAKAGRYTGNVRPRVSAASGSISMPTTNAIAVNATGLPMV